MAGSPRPDGWFTPIPQASTTSPTSSGNSLPINAAGEDSASGNRQEGELRIEARHEFGHVQLRITLRHYGLGWGNDGWNATADLTIEPGEQLTRVAFDLQAMAAGSSDDDAGLDG